MARSGDSRSAKPSSHSGANDSNWLGITEANVLCHSQLGLASGERFWCHLSQTRVVRTSATPLIGMPCSRAPCIFRCCSAEPMSTETDFNVLKALQGICSG
jgi:hypothetical protein